MSYLFRVVFLCAAVSLPCIAVAQSASSNYAQQLKDMGYNEITITTSWLGRTIIRATLNGVTRELVVAKNGQILFDYKDVNQKFAKSPEGESRKKDRSQHAERSDHIAPTDRERTARGGEVTVPILRAKSYHKQHIS